MTDISRSPTTQPVPLIDSIVGSNATPLHPLPSLPIGPTVEEDEDYTIKCICDYQDDDGNTVLCETCETWQHIECYYSGKNPPGEHETHTCVDCEPRPLDGKSATDRQRSKREGRDPGDKKIKKQPTKSHKKKIKPVESHHNLTNGWPSEKHEIASPRNNINGGSKDQHTKRHKSSHKASNSIHSQSVPLKLPSHSRRSTSASHTLQSPVKNSTHHTASDRKEEPFSEEFMHLYDDDPGDTPMEANLFNDIRITGLLALWSNDVAALNEAAHGKGPQDIFMRRDEPVASIMDPQHLTKHTKVDPDVECHGLNPKWTSLTVETPILQNTIVGELRGKIGHMEDYTKDEANRWEYLRHPLPFVFFHNSLPIYIDTRQEGTLLRYVRRSCQANLMMKTFLENGSDYHFCWLANKDLEAGTELTIPWTLDEHVRAFTQKLSGGIKYEGSADTDESYVTDYCAKVLADFGGCACRGPEQCTMKSYASRNRIVPGDPCQPNGKAKKGRKSAAHSSAHGTARETTSRSGSEAFKYQDEDDQDDGQTTSASSRSKPQSRDLTPSHQPPIDNKSMILGPEISDREKRKIAQLEKMEQDKSQPPQKKKKRNSGASILSTPTATASKHQSVDTVSTPLSSSKRYIDAGTSRKQSGSPIARSPFPATSAPTSAPTKSPSITNSPTIPSPLARNDYVDASVQTDPDPEDDWVSVIAGPSVPRRPYVSLKRRLLNKCHQEKALLNNTRMALQAATIENGQKEDENSPSPTTVIAQTKDTDGDVVMQTTEPISPVPEAATSPILEKPRPPGEVSMEPYENDQNQVPPLHPPPLPSQISSPIEVHKEQPLNGFRSTDLRVQLPPKPIFNGHPHTPTVALTPTMAQSPLVQTPSFPGAFSSLNVVQPSPIKKKLTFGDYMSRRSSHHQKAEITPLAGLNGSAKDPEGSPTATSAGSTKPLTTLSEERNDQNMEGSTVSETPRADIGDPMDLDVTKT